MLQLAENRWECCAFVMAGGRLRGCVNPMAQVKAMGSACADEDSSQRAVLLSAAGRAVRCPSVMCALQSAFHTVLLLFLITEVGIKLIRRRENPVNVGNCVLCAQRQRAALLCRTYS